LGNRIRNMKLFGRHLFLDTSSKYCSKTLEHTKPVSDLARVPEDNGPRGSFSRHRLSFLVTTESTAVNELHTSHIQSEPQLQLRISHSGNELSSQGKASSLSRQSFGWNLDGFRWRQEEGSFVSLTVNHRVL